MRNHDRTRWMKPIRLCAGSLAVLLAGTFSPASNGPAAGQQSKTGSSEIKRLYDEDQQDREGIVVLDLSDQNSLLKLQMRDEARRKRARELLNAGALRTAKEFRMAAFIFQHGNAPDDYLTAHVLALVGVAKGDRESRWIAAATLDRYLLSVKQPQVFGTNYSQKDASSPLTQEPYHRDLIPDSLRAALCVPNIGDQEKILESLRKNQEPHLPEVCREP